MAFGVDQPGVEEDVADAAVARRRRQFGVGLFR